MDPLQDVLSVVGATAYLSSGMVAGGAWAVRFGAPPGVKFNSTRQGSCLLQVDGVPGPIPLAPGDCFLLTQPRPFVLASDLGLPAVEAAPLFAVNPQAPAQAGHGQEVMLIGGGFLFNERARSVLLQNLPPVVHIPGDLPAAETIHWALQRIAVELRDRAVGAAAIAEHLAMVMLIEALRLHLPDRPGLLAGLADPLVGDALRALHERPGHPWTVAELALASQVSRSTLAARFKAVVGQGPLEYLTAWRIELASQRLRQGTHTLDRIAREVGYGSESALSTAFKRILGSSPRDYRREHRAISDNVGQ